jgi:hypothetical protein
MHRLASCLWALAVVGVAGCVGGSDGDRPDGGGAGGVGGTSGVGGTGGGSGDAGLGCDSAEHCGGAGFVCGVHAVASCGEVDCGPCRFRADDIGWGDITAASDRSIHLAFFSPSGAGLVYARVGASGLEQETISTTTSGESVAIAVADDGTIHVAFIDTQVMHAAKSPGASWNVQVAAEAGEGVALAVDAAGTVHILVTGEHPQTRQRQVTHVTYDGTMYTATPIEGVIPVGNAAVGRGADGAVVIAVRTDVLELAVLELMDGVFVRDTTVPALEDQPAEWSVVVGSDGTINVVALLGNYTLRTGSQLVMMTRTSGTWSVAPLGPDQPQVTHGIGAAGGPMDTLHVAYYARNADGLFYTRPDSTQRLNVHPQCDDGEVRLAIDADDQPHLLFRCDSGGVTYMAPIERYADSYLDACDVGAELICDRACDCGAPDCCYGDGTADGSGGCKFGPGDTAHTLCVNDMKIGLCGDLAADPAVLLACTPMLDAIAPMCVENSYAIPDACWQLIASSF